jgi:hypothetical protein
MAEEKEQEVIEEPITPEFTQEQVDKMVSDRLARERKKYDKKYAGVDVDAYKGWQAEQEQAEVDRQKERGDFEAILKTTVGKKDDEISQLKNRLTEIEVDGSLLRTASNLNAVSPDQVASLLRSQVRLGDDGNVEVIDKQGVLLYGDTGEMKKVTDLVSDFLTTNPHFVKASLSGAGSVGKVGGGTQTPKPVAEMTHDEYREHRKSIGRGVR